MRGLRQPPILQLLIQIDGLSRPLLESAVERGDAPAIGRTIDDDSMTMTSVFSGLPSTTPAVQAELFYGKRFAVPAFAYLDRKDNVLRHMLDPAAANAVQRKLAIDATGLLAGGAAYCDIYTGGAVAARFCPAGLARPREALSRDLRFQIRSAMAYAGVLVRGVGMLAGEAARGAGGLRVRKFDRLGQRIGDSWNRIIATVALRDQSRISAMNDISLGLPVVHINFVGYDKQAHKYGPDSPPARRAISGIDRAIDSLLTAARESHARHVTAVIYSDHGQEATTPLVECAGESVENMVRRAADDLGLTTTSDSHNAARRHRVSEAISEGFGERVLGIGADRDRDLRITTIESGPIAHVYLETESLKERREDMARRLSQSANDILVLWRTANDEPRAVVGDREFDDLASLCEARMPSHPFRDSMPEELRALLNHENAGDLILFGTGFGDRAVTFASERGSHGGPGADETHAFAILPKTLINPASSSHPLRFESIRDALLKDRSTAEHTAPSDDDQ